MEEDRCGLQKMVMYLKDLEYLRYDGDLVVVMQMEYAKPPISKVIVPSRESQIHYQ